jgi:hypothetical protein
MADDTAPPGDTLDPLQLDRCPDCGYLFTGLPERGLCPECGFGYGPDTLVLYGWSSGWHRRRLSEAARRWRTRLALLGQWWWIPYMAVQVGWQPWRSGRHHFTVFSGLVLLACITPVLVALWRRYIDPPIVGPAPIQLRLTPQGFAVRRNIGKVTLNAWREWHTLHVRPVPDRACSLMIEARSLKHFLLEIPWDQPLLDRLGQRVSCWCKVKMEPS